MKVRCDRADKCTRDTQCGAKKVHDDGYCEPCPFVPTAKCVEVVVTAERIMDMKQAGEVPHIAMNYYPDAPKGKLEDALDVLDEVKLMLKSGEFSEVYSKDAMASDIDKIFHGRPPSLSEMSKKFLQHEYDMTRGLWCIDQHPDDVEIDWIRQNAFQLMGYARG